MKLDTPLTRAWAKIETELEEVKNMARNMGIADDPTAYWPLRCGVLEGRLMQAYCEIERLKEEADDE